jgi:hypothetical protein
MTGGCLCGGVRFELEPPLRDVVVCHCSLCRRSGTLAGAYTAVPREALRLVVQETLTWYVDVNGRRRGFCGGCGATLFWSDEGEETISVSAGALDGPTGLVTTRHIYVADAADWESPGVRGESI